MHLPNLCHLDLGLESGFETHTHTHTHTQKPVLVLFSPPH